ncbi:MAG: hypothetical protein LUD81_07710 [Clostridiales bacterium]|nr:hypothetical protein [Clostridiales bacterium]
MEKIRKYIIDGCELAVPVYYDGLSGKYIEDYSRWIENLIYTPRGHPVLVSSEDACRFAESRDSGPCVECAGCRFYKRARKNTLIGICRNKKRQLKEAVCEC